MTRLDKALRQLWETAREYDRLDADMQALVKGWQLLDPEARRMVGGLAPELVDAVIRIEDKARRLIDA